MERRRSQPFFLTALLLWASAVEGFETSCDAPEVNIREAVNITCTFFKDIKDAEFVIRRFPFLENGAGIDVVDCFFIGGGKRHCDVLPGYSFDCVPGNTQILTVTHANETFEGTYMCQMLTSDPQECDRCDLKVLDSNSLDDGMKVPSGDDGEHEQKCDGNDVPVAPIVIPLVITVVVTLVVVVFISRRRRTCLFKQKQRPQAHKTDTHSDTEDPMQNDANDKCIEKQITDEEEKLGEVHFSETDGATAPKFAPACNQEQAFQQSKVDGDFDVETLKQDDENNTSNDTTDDAGTYDLQEGKQCVDDRDSLHNATLTDEESASLSKDKREQEPLVPRRGSDEHLEANKRSAMSVRTGVHHTTMTPVTLPMKGAHRQSQAWVKEEGGRKRTGETETCHQSKNQQSDTPLLASTPSTTTC